MSVIISEIYDFLIQIWMEVFFVLCFGVAFSMLQLQKGKRGKTSGKVQQYFKNVHAEATSGSAAKVISAWRAVKAQRPAPTDTLKVVAQAFLDAEPASLVRELIEHLSLHPPKASEAKAATAVLEVVAQAGQEDIMEKLFQGFVRELRISATPHMHELLLGGYAAAGNKEKASQMVKKLRESGQKVSVRGYSLMAKGFLKNGMLDAAIEQVKEMRSQGLNVPSFAVLELFRAAREQGRAIEIFQELQNKVAMTTDSLTFVAEECLKLNNVTAAKSLEGWARGNKLQMNFTTCEALLKIYTCAGDAQALDLFQDMQKSFAYISDGLCTSLVSRCAESKFLKLAEAIVAFVRSRGKMTLVMYSALMKVYSYSNLHSRACDLYDELRADGLEPDATMYGCLMKFSASCGRTELTRELSSKVQGTDIHHHMALIRAAGQDKDVDKAFSVIEKLKASGHPLDTLVCNAVLDVCSSVGDMQRARGLVREMKDGKLLDVISYNTLLKGYCMHKDLKAARQTMVEMDKGGFPPNDISYNCLINLAASSGDFRAAWEIIETMERKGVHIDHYTVSTMMKALKNSRASKDIVKGVMALLDRKGIDVCCEEVLLNTAMEACIKHNEHRRLAEILAHVEKSQKTKKLAVHTYATLIRASGILKRKQKCHDLWKEMTQVQGLEPNDVALGCMIDALVCNGDVLEGVRLLRKWQDGKRGNSVVLYSTLIKGFTGTGDTRAAQEMWEELLEQKLQLNTMVFNAIIDAHARAGNMQKVQALVQSMKTETCQPDDITWSMVAKGYCVKGDLDKALEVFRSLPSQSSPNTVIIYNTLLDGCVRHNRNDLADYLLANMREWQIQASNFTLGIIVKMWGRRRQISKAFAAVEELPKEYGFVPNGPVLNSLLFGCLRNDQLEKALEVYGELRAAGHPTASNIMGALINNCVRAGNAEKAVALVEEAYGLARGTRRVMPASDDLDGSCLEQLLKLLTRQGLLDKMGVPLLKQLRVAKVPLSTRLVSSVGEQGLL
jgi:pentatricopeptide repeat protein